MTAVHITQEFLGHIFSGSIDAALALVAPDAIFIGSRPIPSPENPLFGTFRGEDGAREFFATFADLIEPGDFKVDGQFGSDAAACFYGSFRHHVRATGVPFPSDWALVTRVHEGRMTFYHFYEDTEALSRALAPLSA